MKSRKNVSAKINALLMLASLLVTIEGYSQISDVTPQPIGKVSESPYQLKIRFPDQVQKVENAFQVVCNPHMEGYEGWADNNTLWTFTFANEGRSSLMPGGSVCKIQQTKEIRAQGGKTWKLGTISYDVKVVGPAVYVVQPAHGFNGFVREKDPVVLIKFNGDIIKEKFFSEQNGHMQYLGANLPAEKMALVPVPADQEAKLIEYFKEYTWGVGPETKNWVIATVRQNLVPGSSVSLRIQNVQSAFDSSQRMEKPYAVELKVRPNFAADIKCTALSADNSSCLPKAPIFVNFNSRVKWADAKNTFIEYIPFGQKSGKPVRSYPELKKNEEDSISNRAINFVSTYLPFAARLSTTTVEGLEFKLNIEPETVAKVVLPSNLVDVEGRKLSNALTEFSLRIGSLGEILRVPGPMAIYEKNVPNTYLPVRVVNLNQKLVIRKTGTEQPNSEWTSVQDSKTIVSLIEAYNKRGDYRKVPEYVSPMQTLGVSNNKTEVLLTGEKNRYNVMQVPFAAAGKTAKSGVYALEISSPSLDSQLDDKEKSRFHNPKFVLAQVTDLAVHMKKGVEKTLIWVTRYSNGQSVSGAQVEVLDCAGAKVGSVQTNQSGLAEISSTLAKANCNGSANEDDEDSRPGAVNTEFYVFARMGDDVSFSHSTWRSPHSNALRAPGIEYFYSQIRENEPMFHSIIGVNLVKPGQKVPVQVLARVPHGNGIGTIPHNLLPAKARVVNDNDPNVFYEFPLTWNDDSATFTWEVPSGSAAKLGEYEINFLNAKGEVVRSGSSSGSIEVAEFTVPIMTGSLAFKNQTLVRPDSIQGTTLVRYANGVGAKALPITLTYFFEKASLHFEKLEGFKFANGNVQVPKQDDSLTKSGLPTHKRPTAIEGQTTNAEGALAYDFALDKIADGRQVREVLKTLGNPVQLVVRAKYQDQMGEFQTLSQGKVVFNAEKYVGTKVVKGDRTTAKLQSVIVNAEGKPVTLADEVKMDVLRVETKVIGEELFGGLIKNTVEKEYKAVRWNGGCNLENGLVSCSVTALKAGSYVLQAVSKDGSATAHTLFKVGKDGNVYGEHDYYYFGDENDQKMLPLALNKKSYKGGEKALVSFPAPFKTCNALITIERSNVVRAIVQSGACEKGSVEIPVESGLAPNAFVSIYAITGRAQGKEVKNNEADLGKPAYRLGFANLKIDWDNFEANVKVKTGKDVYEPKEDVEVTVNASAAVGNMNKAKVTVIAIEEKILELKENKTYEVLAALMQMRGHSVRTITSLNHIETVAIGENPEHDDNKRKGGDDGGDGGSATQMKRKLFDALVFFKEGIPLVNGVAKTSFKANDSLTKFKVFAIVTSTENKFGIASTQFLASQDTQTYTNIPQVAHTGDEFPLKVNLQNNGAKDQTYTTDVTVEIYDENGNKIGTKTISKAHQVGKGSSTQVDLGKIEIPDNAGKIKYVVKVKDASGKVVDIIEPAAQVVMPTVPVAVRDSFLEQMTGDTFTKSIVKHENALPNKGAVSVVAAKSLVFGARTKIAERIDQDRFAQFFLESKFYSALLSGSKDKMKAVYQDILGNTDHRGFVKFFPAAHRGSIWLTAAIVSVLNGEKWALEVMPQALASKFTKAFSAVLNKTVEPDYYANRPEVLGFAQLLTGYAVFAMNEPKLMEEARKSFATIQEEIPKKEMGLFKLALDKWHNDDVLNYLLFQAMVQPEKVLSSEGFKLLTAGRLVYSGNQAQVQGKPVYNGYSYSDEIMDTGKLLSVLSFVKGSNDMARALAAGLVNSSRGSWYVTSTLVWIGGALKKFGQVYESVPVSGTVTLKTSESKQEMTGDWTSASTFAENSDWKNMTTSVEVRNVGQGKPWISIQAKQAIPLKAPISQGLAISKSLKNLSRDSGFKPGDLIEVTLKIQASAAISHIGIVDPIPGGANIMGEPYGYFSASEKSYKGVKVYFENLDTGLSEVKYQYQLNNPGKFNMAPTRAEGIYFPSVFAETPNSTMVVQ